MTRNDSRRSQVIPDTSERHEPHIEILKIETIGPKSDITNFKFAVFSEVLTVSITENTVHTGCLDVVHGAIWRENRSRRLSRHQRTGEKSRI